MIIIEGPDNSGKSTLGKALEKALNLPLRHSERPNPAWTPEEALAHAQRQLRPSAVLLDRVYTISEYVYGPICRGKSGLGDLHHEALMDLYHRPYLIIYCRPPDAVILDNLGREQMDGVLENHSAIIKSYDSLMEELSIYGSSTILRYNWKDSGHLPKVIDTAHKHMVNYRSKMYSSFYLNLGVK